MNIEQTIEMLQHQINSLRNAEHYAMEIHNQYNVDSENEMMYAETLHIETANDVIVIGVAIEQLENAIAEIKRNNPSRIDNMRTATTRFGIEHGIKKHLIDGMRNDGQILTSLIELYDKYEYPDFHYDMNLSEQQNFYRFLTIADDVDSGGVCENFKYFEPNEPKTHETIHYINFNNVKIEIGRSQYDIETGLKSLQYTFESTATHGDLYVNMIARCDTPHGNELFLYRVFNSQNGENCYFIVNYPELTNVDKPLNEIIYTIECESDFDYDALTEFQNELSNYMI